MENYVGTSQWNDVSQEENSDCLKKLSKRTLIKVDALGDYTIHENIEQGAILVTQKT